MGGASAKAQGLNVPVTSYNVLLQSPDQRLYIFTEGKVVVGIIKIGRKKLFIRSELDVHKEISPMCVLDFYVHESMQRTGKGKMLFEAMLEREGLQAWNLGYDRPSIKFVNFLRKHYGLSDFTPQANNFVVFRRYFEESRSATRNEQPNASVSMRPLTAPQNKRRNSVDGSTHGLQQQQQQQPAYYTPQKPQSRPETVTPLALNQLPKNGHNPYSLKANPPPAQQPSTLSRGNSNGNLPTRQTGTKSYEPPKSGNTERTSYDNDRSNYNDRSSNDRANNDRSNYNDRSNNDRANYSNRSGTNGKTNYNDEDKYNDREYDNEESNYSNRETYNGSNTNYRDNNDDRDRYSSTNHNQYDDDRVDYDNTATKEQPFFATTSASYGSHSPAPRRGPSPARRAPSPGPSIPPYAVSNGNNYTSPTNLNSTGGIFGISNPNYNDITTVRGRSPGRQRSESPLDNTSSPSQQRSSSQQGSHIPPKGLGTLGSFTQSFTHPMKFEKDVTAPPQQATAYKDASLFPPRRETTQQRSPAYRLDRASHLNSREMDHLENSMRNALSVIDTNERRSELLDEGGYRAVSPEPKVPVRQERYQSPQSRSIFSSVQPTGSPPVARSVSPAQFANRGREDPDQFDTSFSKSDYHKKFNNENPALMTSSPVQVRVHPNSRSRQSPFPT